MDGGTGLVGLVDSHADGRNLTRRIVTFRDVGDGRLRRAEETHGLLLHRPANVLARLRRAGFTARTLPGGYSGVELPRGLSAYVARRSGAPAHDRMA